MLQKLIKRLTILSFILVMGAGLSGCAFKSIIYERLDWVVMYQLDSYLDMDKAQKLKFKPLVTEAITWLKRDKLPGAIVVFDKLILAAQNKSYDDTMSKALSAELDGIRVDLFKKYEAPILSLLLSLDGKQIEYFNKKLKKSNENLEEVLEDNEPSDYENLLKRQRKTLKEYYGDLRPEQVTYFSETMRVNREQLSKRLSERKRLQTYIVETLKSKDAVKISAMISSMRDHGEVWQDKDYLEYRRTGEKQWADYLTVFHSSLDQAQWTHVEGKLREIREDLMQLSGRKS